MIFYPYLIYQFPEHPLIFYIFHEYEFGPSFFHTHLWFENKRVWLWLLKRAGMNYTRWKWPHSLLLMVRWPSQYARGTVVSIVQCIREHSVVIIAEKICAGINYLACFIIDYAYTQKYSNRIIYAASNNGNSLTSWNLTWYDHVWKVKVICWYEISNWT